MANTVLFWQNKVVFLANSVIFWAYIVVVMANTVLYMGNTAVLWPNTDGFEDHKVIFGTNTVDFCPNAVVFGANSVVSGQWSVVSSSGHCQLFLKMVCVFDNLALQEMTDASKKAKSGIHDTRQTSLLNDLTTIINIGLIVILPFFYYHLMSFQEFSFLLNERKCLFKQRKLYWVIYI